MVSVRVSTANGVPVAFHAAVVLLGLWFCVPGVSCATLHRQHSAVTTATTVSGTTSTHVSRQHQQQQHQQQHQQRGQRGHDDVDTTSPSTITLRRGGGRSDLACFAASAWSGARHVPRIRHDGVKNSCTTRRCDRTFSMKAKRKGGGGGAGSSSGTATAVRRNGTKKAQHIQIEDLSSDSWRYGGFSH